VPARQRLFIDRRGNIDLVIRPNPKAHRQIKPLEYTKHNRSSRTKKYPSKK
jgi:hypothetical protein